MQTDQNGTANSEWCVRGDRAYPLTDPNGARSLSASSLRTIKSVVEAALRGDAILSGQKPPSLSLPVYDASEPPRQIIGREVRLEYRSR